MFEENVSQQVSEDILSQIIHGLKESKKYLPTSLLFETDNATIEKLTCSREYYITKVEAKILTEYIDEICAFIGDNPLLIDFSSGDGPSTRILFDHIQDISGYIPVDNYSPNLQLSMEILRQEYPGVEIKPLNAFLKNKFELPQIENLFEQRVFFLPGSRISCFTPFEAKNFLKRISRMCGENGLLFAGLDLKKDKKLLEQAYNDKEGITKEMNLSILSNLNEKYGNLFSVENFTHSAVYNELLGRVEMYLESKCEQNIKIFGDTINLDKNEKILTQYFYKYSLEEFEDLVYPYFDSACIWMDKEKSYCLQILKVIE